MTDRPIIFSAPMVLALLAGRKTQTRRLAWGKADYDGGRLGWPKSRWHRVQPGDRLWVRETWAPHPDGVMRYGAVYRLGHESEAKAGPGIERWRSPIHMPRWASRLTLTVTDVLVQRLQELTDADAQAEGIAQFENGRWHYEPNPEPAYARLTGPTARDAFHDLWHTIHGPGAWDANPEVVALTFTAEQRNIDAIGGGA